MKLLILLMTLAAPGWGAWSVCKAVTVNSGQVTSGPHSNFKMVISGTYSWLASTGNGGVMTDAQGDDLRVYSTSDCSTTAIAYQRVHWTATGVIELWVRVSSMDNGSVVYIGAGDAGVTTDGSNAAGVWAEEHAVYLFPDGSTLSALDSGPNGYTLTNTGVAATSGKIDGAAAFDGGASGDNLVTSASAATAYTTMSTCVWINATGFDTTARRVYQNGNLMDQIFGDTTNNFVFNAGWTTANGAWYTTLPSTGSWQHVCVTYDGGSTANDPVIYVNGSSQSVTETVAPSGSKVTSTGTLIIGNRPGNDRTWNGSIDTFVRVQETIWSAGLIATMYNNQNAPDTFYTISDQNSGTRRRIVVVQ